MIRDLNGLADLQRRILAMENGNADLPLRCSAVSEFMDVVTASAFFYACCESKTPLVEFEDAILRAGSRPLRDDPNCYPWQLVAIKMAIDYELNFLAEVEDEGKKKASTED